MKVRVIKEFIDKYTREFHGIGEEILLSEERFAEIEKAGAYVEKLPQDESDGRTPAAQDGVQGKVDADEQSAADESPQLDHMKKTRRSRK